jgi:hypothetical protein
VRKTSRWTHSSLMMRRSRLLRTLQLSPHAQILRICVQCFVIYNVLYSTLSTPKATFWAGQDLSCPDPCTKCSARAHSAYRRIPDRRRFIMGQESPFSIHQVIPSMTQPATQRTFLSLLSIAPCKRQSTLISYVSETTGSRTRTSKEHATTYSTKPSTTHSSSPLTPTSLDGIHRWKSSTSCSK